MKQILNEVKRSQSLNKSKKGDEYVWWNQLLGKNRHERRLHQKVSRSVANYNKLNMNKLFKDDILDVNIEVKGETDNYLVRISFSGFLQNFQKINKVPGEIKLKDITRALTMSFNMEDVYFRCTCPDWQYRQGYWATQNGTIVGDPETRPSNITNPNDTKGGMCKHVAIVMSNNSWIMKVASVIRNYTLYMEKHMPDLYYKVIFPALYGIEYDEVQMDINDITGQERELGTEEDDIDISNKWAKTKTQFKPGNEFRYRPINQDDEDSIPGQKSFNFDSEISD